MYLENLTLSRATRVWQAVHPSHFIPRPKDWHPNLDRCKILQVPFYIHVQFKHLENLHWVFAFLQKISISRYFTTSFPLQLSCSPKLSKWIADVPNFCLEFTNKPACWICIIQLLNSFYHLYLRPTQYFLCSIENFDDINWFLFNPRNFLTTIVFSFSLIFQKFRQWNRSH